MPANAFKKAGILKIRRNIEHCCNIQNMLPWLINSCTSMVKILCGSICLNWTPVCFPTWNGTQKTHLSVSSLFVMGTWCEIPLNKLKGTFYNSELNGSRGQLCIALWAANKHGKQETCHWLIDTVCPDKHVRQLQQTTPTISMALVGFSVWNQNKPWVNATKV